MLATTASLARLEARLSAGQVSDFAPPRPAQPVGSDTVVTTVGMDGSPLVAADNNGGADDDGGSGVAGAHAMREATTDVFTFYNQVFMPHTLVTFQQLRGGVIQG